MKTFLKLLIVFFAVTSFVIGAANVKYKVDPDKCVGCGTCVSGCPEKAISMVKEKAYIDPEKCIGCGACFSVCPVKAISKDSLALKVDKKLNLETK